MLVAPIQAALRVLRGDHGCSAPEVLAPQGHSYFLASPRLLYSAASVASRNCIIISEDCQGTGRVCAVLHNFACRTADRTTLASRFFRRTFPDLFETLLPTIGALPRPRQRTCTPVLSH